MQRTLTILVTVTRCCRESPRPPPVIPLRRQYHRLRHRLLAAVIVSDGAAGEAEGLGGAVEGESVAVHPGAEGRRRHRLAGLLVGPAAELRGAEVDAEGRPFDGP